MKEHISVGNPYHSRFVRGVIRVKVGSIHTGSVEYMQLEYWRNLGHNWQRREKMFNELVIRLALFGVFTFVIFTLAAESIKRANGM